jgi:hypothetical protein
MISRISVDETRSRYSREGMRVIYITRSRGIPGATS